MATDFVPQLVNTMSTLDTAQINIPALKDTRLVDTPMIVTLDQLQAYDHDPRLRRNPRYDDIKASIRHRGLDTPPSITRRPGESCFRIRNGGNTRLSILRELWLETRENQFFEFPCMFRPWPERGEIVALTGHLAENELRGALTFIERALGVEKAREIYEQEHGRAISQSELSRRLTADGYPVQQSHISRMRDATEYLLPVIPNLLYGGLGRHQVERLAVMRRSFSRTWDEYAKGKVLDTDFSSLFNESLRGFDGAVSDFKVARVQDEIVGQMALYLGVDYDTLVVSSEASDRRERVLLATPYAASAPLPILLDFSAVSTQEAEHAASLPSVNENPLMEPRLVDPPVDVFAQETAAKQDGEAPTEAIADSPIAQENLFTIEDIWSIEPALDKPEQLRTHISQFAREICQDVAQADLITEVNDGIGFRCSTDVAPDHPSGLIGLLETLTTGTPSAVDIRPLLLGSLLPSPQIDRLSDSSLMKLFRLIRLARRLIDFETGNDTALAPSLEAI